MNLILSDMNPFMMAYALCTAFSIVLDICALIVTWTYFGVKGEESQEMVLFLLNLANLYCLYLWISFVCQIKNRLPLAIA